MILRKKLGIIFKPPEQVQLYTKIPCFKVKMTESSLGVGVPRGNRFELWIPFVFTEYSPLRTRCLICLLIEALISARWRGKFVTTDMTFLLMALRSVTTLAIKISISNNPIRADNLLIGSTNASYSKVYQRYNVESWLKVTAQGRLSVSVLHLAARWLWTNNTYVLNVLQDIYPLRLMWEFDGLPCKSLRKVPMFGNVCHILKTMPLMLELMQANDVIKESIVSLISFQLFLPKNLTMTAFKEPYQASRKTYNNLTT